MVKKALRLYPKQIVTAVGAGAVLLFYLSWCLSTISYRGELFTLLCGVGMTLTAALYLGCVVLFLRYWKDNTIKRQLWFLNLFLLAFFVVLAAFGGRELGREGKFPILLSELFWIMAALFCFIKLENFSKHMAAKCVAKVSRICREHYPLLAVLLFTALLTPDTAGLPLKWDGGLYYQACSEMSLYSLSSMGAFGHLSQGYGFLVCLAALVFRNLGIAMALMNLLLLEISICAFYELIRFLAPGQKNILYGIAAAVYAFSPFLLGMVNYYSLDYYSLLLFVPVVYFTYKKQWIFQFVFSLLYCFTKEPAFVVYGTFCVGLVLYDLLYGKNEVDDSFGRRLKRVLQSKQYYLMLLTGLLWIVTYAMLGGWSGGAGSFSFSVSYMADKLKVLYVLNFNWIFVLVILAGFVVLCRKENRSKARQRVLLPLICCQLSFTWFSVGFQTSNHPRYAAAGPAVLYILAVVMIFWFLKPQISRWLLVGAAALLLVSCYRTIDPISLLCFEKADIGERNMVTTARLTPGDGMLYNKELLWMEVPMNQALAYGLSQDAEIIFPAEEGNSYHFDGFALNREADGESAFIREYWNARKQRRMPYSEVDCQELRVSQLTEKLNLPGRAEGRLFCYIYSPLAGGEMAKAIEEQYDVIEKRQFSYRGWVIEVLLF